MDSKAIFEIQDLTFSYDSERNLLNQVNLSLYDGEILTLLGPNGAGKTTIFSCIEGSVRNYSGRITFNGQDVRNYSARELSQNIGYMTQFQSILPDMNVMDYVLLGCAPYLNVFEHPDDEAYTHTYNILQELGLQHLRNRAVGKLSGGELQQVQIARLLLQNPKMILLDEPTNHLDYGNQIKLLELIKRLVQEKNISVIMTSHTPDHVFILNSRVGILNRSGEMIVGKAEEVLSEELLEDLYQCKITLKYIPEIARYACLTGKMR